MVYKIRVILNAEDDVIRDIAIEASSSLEDLHNAINNAFGFYGDQMASFYVSDDKWSQGAEYPLFDMSESAGEVVPMSEVDLEEMFIRRSKKLIYVYDFFNMWSFYVELIDSDFDHNNLELPRLVFSLGNIPSHAPEIHFESDDRGNRDRMDDDDFEEDEDEDFYPQNDEDFPDFHYN